MEGFNYIYKSYSPVLYGVICKIINDENTAQDILQEVFMKIWNNADKYDANKGRLYTWMLNIARNSAIDKLRSKGEIMKSKIQNNENIVDYLTDMMQTEQKTDTIGLHKIVSGLRPEYEVIIQLSYFKGYTFEEISGILSIPLGTVKTRMRSALMELRNLYKNK